MSERKCNKDACGRCIWCEYGAGNHDCPKCDNPLKYDFYIGKLKCVKCEYEEE